MENAVVVKFEREALPRQALKSLPSGAGPERPNSGAMRTSRRSTHVNNAVPLETAAGNDYGERHERRLARRRLGRLGRLRSWAVSGARESRESGTRGDDHLGIGAGAVKGEEAGVLARLDATPNEGHLRRWIHRFPESLGTRSMIMTQGHWQTRKGCLTVTT